MFGCIKVVSNRAATINRTTQTEADSKEAADVTSFFGFVLSLKKAAEKRTSACV
jgi:hypothetical protein